MRYKVSISEDAFEFFKLKGIPFSLIVNHALITHLDDCINLPLVRETSRSLCKSVNVTLGPLAQDIFVQTRSDYLSPISQISPRLFVPISLSRIIEYAYSTWDKNPLEIPQNPYLATLLNDTLVNQLLTKETLSDFIIYYYKLQETLL